jgi:hypothetical protein
VDGRRRFAIAAEECRILNLVVEVLHDAIHLVVKLEVLLEADEGIPAMGNAVAVLY